MPSQSATPDPAQLPPPVHITSSHAPPPNPTSDPTQALPPSNPLRPLSLSEYLTLTSHLAPVMGQRPVTQQQQAHVLKSALNLNSNSNLDPGAEGLSEADFDSLFQLCRQRREKLDRLLEGGQVRGGR